MGWLQLWDDSKKLVYFFNEDTGESVWESPHGEVITELPADINPDRVPPVAKEDKAMLTELFEDVYTAGVNHKGPELAEDALQAHLNQYIQRIERLYRKISRHTESDIIEYVCCVWLMGFRFKKFLSPPLRLCSWVELMLMDGLSSVIQSVVSRYCMYAEDSVKQDMQKKAAKYTITNVTEHVSMSSDSDSIVKKRPRGRGRGKAPKVIEVDSDSSDSSDSSIVKRPRGKAPKVSNDSEIDVSDDDDVEDYGAGGGEGGTVVDLGSRSCTKKPRYKFKSREERLKELQEPSSSSDEIEEVSSDSSLSDDIEEVSSDDIERDTERITAKWRGEFETYRTQFRDLFDQLELTDYLPSIVPNKRTHGAKQPLEIGKVVDLCTFYGYKIAVVEINYETGFYEFENTLTTFSHWGKDINDVLNACSDRNRATFQTSFKEADIGIVNTHWQNPIYHSLIMFKRDGQWVLVDSNRYDPTNEDDYTDFQHKTARMMSDLVEQERVKVITTLIQKDQQDTFQWFLDAHGLCHAFSTLTAVLLIRNQFDFSKVMQLLGQLNAEQNAYVATVFMCSCVKFYMGKKWSLLRKVKSSSGGGGARRSASEHEYPTLKGFTNISMQTGYYGKTNPDIYKTVAFLIQDGYCKHFLPSLINDKDALIETLATEDFRDRLKTLYRVDDVSELQITHRVRTVSDLLDKSKYSEDKTWCVTVRVGSKGLTHGYWQPFDFYTDVYDHDSNTFKILSSSDPFQFIKHVQNDASYESVRNFVQLNCIEILKVEEYSDDVKFTMTLSDYTFRPKNPYVGTQRDYLSKLIEKLVPREQRLKWRNKVGNGNMWAVYVNPSKKFRVISRGYSDPPREAKKIGYFFIRKHERLREGVTELVSTEPYGGQVEDIPIYVDCFYLHDWEPAFTMYFQQLPQLASSFASKLMLLLC